MLRLMTASLKERRLRRMLRKIILTLEKKTKYGVRPEVISFAQALEATAYMARGTKIDTEVTITCTRRELDVFIRYVTLIHDEKLSSLEQARIGLATFILRDQGALGDDPKKVLGGAAKAIKDKNIEPGILVSNAIAKDPHGKIPRKVLMSMFTGGRRKKR